MLLNPEGPPEPIRARGRILVPDPVSGGGLSMFEEEIPREGIRVTRNYQLTRWQDGSTHFVDRPSQSRGKRRRIERPAVRHGEARFGFGAGAALSRRSGDWVRQRRARWIVPHTMMTARVAVTRIPTIAAITEPTTSATTRSTVMIAANRTPPAIIFTRPRNFGVVSDSCGSLIWSR
jgi:hypothetical protein